MTQQVYESAMVSVLALAKVADLCSEGLPVPISTQITSGPCRVWLTLHLADVSEVEAWASQLGVSPVLDEDVYTTSRRWQVYRANVGGDDAEACWAPGVRQVRVWCSVDCDEVERWTDCIEAVPS